MPVRRRILFLSLLSACVFVRFTVGAEHVALSGTRPNIVFFLADDQSRFDHSAYGNPRVPTPTTDSFSKQALVFDCAFTGQAICAPSRSMLYSGLYPIRNGCFLNHTSVRPGVKTVAHYLKDLDYSVILAGKSHVNPSRQFPWTKHFQPEKRKGLPRPWIPVDEMDEFFADQGERPFCMIVASEYPHGPYIKDTPYTAEDIEFPPGARPNEYGLKRATQYYASIAEKEKEFAAVLELLKKHGLEENTIVFYSDAHGADGGKFTVTDRGLQVAFIARWPGRIVPGRTQALTSFADFVPTAIELAGGTPGTGFDGMSLIPVLEGRSETHHSYVYGVAHNQGIQQRAVFPQRSIHDGRYHYVFNFNSVERIEREGVKRGSVGYFLERGAREHGLAEEQLFDTEKDPHERNNLARNPEFAAQKARMKQQLFAWMEQQNDHLTEHGDITLFDVKKHKLNESEPQFNYIVPEAHTGSLDGHLSDAHTITSPN